MRSRYCAFALRDEEYLLATWQAQQRPKSLELQQDIRWTGLRIINFQPGEDQASVEFEASLLQAGRVSAMHEYSRFVREQGKWLYCDGDSLPPSFEAWKPGRNEICPCASGRKFKRCCAQN